MKTLVLSFSITTLLLCNIASYAVVHYCNANVHGGPFTCMINSNVANANVAYWSYHSKGCAILATPQPTGAYYDCNDANLNSAQAGAIAQSSMRHGAVCAYNNTAFTIQCS